MLQVDEETSCCCLAVDDLANSLTEISPYTLDSLAPSPWRACSSPPSDYHIQSTVLGDSALEVFLKKPVSETNKQQPRAGLTSQKQKIIGDGEKRFSHLDPHKYILAYRASRTNGIASAGTEK